MKNLDVMLRAIEEAQNSRITALQKRGSIDITPHIAAVYLPVHDDIQAKGHRYYNLPGGRGSCKSSFVSLEVVSGIMSDKTSESNAVVFRKYGTTLRDSVFSQIAWAIDTLGVSHLWKSSVSPMQYTYLPTGQQIIFRGLDDKAKLKSLKAQRGYYRIIWFEEFSELDGSNFVRSVIQSVMRGQGDFTVFRSFNPPQSKSNWANAVVAMPDEKALTLHTTYKDVPPEWLGEGFLYEAERLKAINETAYNHEYLGIATGTGGEVFPSVEERHITEEDLQQYQYIYAGVDWGFSVDPCVFLRVAYDRKTENVILLDEIYQRHLSNVQFAQLIKERKFDIANGYCDRQLIICDSSEPKSISDFKAEGLKATGCKKYQGSVIYGVKWLQRRRIVIDPARTPNAYREFSQYEYARTRDGEFLSDVPDADNHCIDACRYALDRLINSRLYTA